MLRYNFKPECDSLKVINSQKYILSTPKFCFPSVLSSCQIRGGGRPQPAAEPAAGLEAEPAVAAAATPRTHQSCRTLAPSALTPQIPRDDRVVGPNPPKFPPSPRRPPAQRHQDLQRSNTSYKTTGAELLLLPSTEGGLLSSAILGVPALKSERPLIALALNLCTMTDIS